MRAASPRPIKRLRCLQNETPAEICRCLSSQGCPPQLHLGHAHFVSIALPFPQVNDYLARRDCEWVGQVHRFLGLTVGLVQQGMSEKDRQAAYASDVTYVTNSEVGFDYLRDNLATALDELARKPAALPL